MIQGLCMPLGVILECCACLIFMTTIHNTSNPNPFGGFELSAFIGELTVEKGIPSRRKYIHRLILKMVAFRTVLLRF
jgi:hypothetical protein